MMAAKQLQKTGVEIPNGKHFKRTNSAITTNQLPQTNANPNMTSFTMENLVSDVGLDDNPRSATEGKLEPFPLSLSPFKFMVSSSMSSEFESLLNSSKSTVLARTANICGAPQSSGEHFF